MNTTIIRPGSFQAWLAASRPKTLPAAAAPVLVGTGAAIGDRTFNLLPAIAALLGSLLIQIGTNFANDYFDFVKGADTPDRQGPIRASAAGLIKPRSMIQAMGLTFGAAVVIGLYLVLVGGWPIVVIGVLSILSGIAYTGGPFPLGYNGLGDVFVFIFFGIVAVCGTYYVQALTLTPTAIWAAIPVGLLATTILVVNNLRDIRTDSVVGKRTLAVRFGVQFTYVEYQTLLVLSYSVPLLMIVLGISNGWVLLPFLSLALVPNLLQIVLKLEGRALNQGLAGSARLELVFCILFAIGLALK